MTVIGLMSGLQYGLDIWHKAMNTKRILLLLFYSPMTLTENVFGARSPTKFLKLLII